MNASILSYAVEISSVTAKVTFRFSIPIRHSFRLQMIQFHIYYLKLKCSRVLLQILVFVRASYVNIHWNEAVGLTDNKPFWVAFLFAHSNVFMNRTQTRSICLNIVVCPLEPFTTFVSTYKSILFENNVFNKVKRRVKNVEFIASYSEFSVYYKRTLVVCRYAYTRPRIRYNILK